MGVYLAVELSAAYGSIQNKQFHHHITSYIHCLRRYDIQPWLKAPRKIKLALLLVLEEIRHDAAF
jgi:hypothetical protein